MTAREQVEAVWDRRIEWMQVTPEKGYLNGFREVYADLAVKDFPATEELAWQSALAFTQQRLKEIAELDEEIHALLYQAVFPEACDAALTRIISRLKAQRCELTKDLKTKP